ncbi:peptidase C39 family protein [Micrococcales bacterium 31B]|nr:peptidase C39 family protein [Micrococcales bacterium 31B]
MQSQPQPLAAFALSDKKKWGNEAVTLTAAPGGQRIDGSGISIDLRHFVSDELARVATSCVPEESLHTVWQTEMQFLDFEAKDLIPSWNALAAPYGFLHVEVRIGRGTPASSAWSTWFPIADWASGMDTDKGTIARTSFKSPKSDWGHTEIDTLVASGSFTAYQLRVTCDPMKAESVNQTHRLMHASVVATTARAAGSAPRPNASDAAVDNDVPTRSQWIHEGEYTKYGGGGLSWCSPTTATMLAAYWGHLPTPAELATIEAPADPEVDFAALHTFDTNYGGCGNWPFTMAYASRFGLVASVTRLRDLEDARVLLSAGIPLGVSVAFTREELPEAGYPTSGHLMVVRGLTAEGDVIVNDPATPSNDHVNRVYPRDKFEKVWLKSNCTTYLMHPRGYEVPTLG